MAEPKTNCNNDPGAFPPICLKLKFHFIKYLGTKEEFPSDKLYVDLLDQINDVFAQGNIKFTFDSDCINYIVYDSNFNTGDKPGDDSERKSTVLNNKTTFGFDDEAINVYSFTTSGGGEAYLGQNILFCASNFSALTHELGHTLGLVHTFGKGNPYAIPNTSLILPFSKPWVCKNGNNDSGFQGDDVSDTGADPYTMDLDGNGYGDQHNWFIESNCSQNIANAVKDDCNDQTNPWNIPVDNWMSYYGACKKCFTQGQYERMHQYIEDYFEDMVRTDCDNDPYFDPVDCQLADITISTPVVWENGILEMCKDQKIIIEAGGSLTLRNYTITKKQGPIPNCPDLSKYGEWDGVYLNAYSTNNNSTKPSLLVLENSKISYSKNGIIAIQFDEIRFDQSKMVNNGAGIQAKHGASGVYILNNSLIDGSGANITSTNRASYRHISCINTALSISASTVIGKGLSTGIYSYFGTVQIVNQSKIKNFETCIYKDADMMKGGFDAFGSSGAGLVVSNSSLEAKIDKYEAIYMNGTKDAVIFDNTIIGNVVSRGKCTGIMYHNYLLDVLNGVNSVSIANPELSFELKDNLFEKTKIELYGNNNLTNAICNSWKNPQAYAVYHAGKPTIGSWGTSFGSSGNRVTTNDIAVMIATEAEITNYFWTDEPAETRFSYAGQFEGKGIDYGTTCNYRLAGIQGTNGLEEDCDELQAENDWDSLEVLMTDLLVNIENETDSILKKQMTEQYNHLNLHQGLLEARMVKCHRDLDSSWSQQAQNWLDRLDPELSILDEVGAFWNGEQFGQVSGFEGIPEAAADDYQILFDAALLLQGWYEDSLDIYDLHTAQLDSLAALAQSNFGNYSNLLRAWLHAHYGIRIDWPAYLQSYSKQVPQKMDEEGPAVRIFPNPIDQCFYLNLAGGSGTFHLCLLNLQGVQVYATKMHTGQEICLPTSMESGLYLIQLKGADSKPQTAKLWLR